MATPTPSSASTSDPGDPDRRQSVEKLKQLLAVERSHRMRIQGELDLRNCALDAATSHVMIFDVSRPRWSIVYANRAIARDHGYEPSEILGQSPDWLVPEESNHEASARINEAVRSGSTISTELQARRKDGSSFRVGMFMAPVSNAPDIVSHYIAIGADITSRLEHEGAKKELQEKLVNEMRERERMAIELRLSQKLESVGRLAAGIAHEINTPIQYIGDSVVFLKSTEQQMRQLRAALRDALARLAGAEQFEAVMAPIRQLEIDIDTEFLVKEVPKAFERTLEGVERVAAIVRAMKEFAHPDSVEHSSADLNHALETTLTVAHNEYKYSAQVETRFGELPLVVCNVGEINQVFLNLIVNAAHTISESGKDIASGRIIITTLASGSDVEIRIEDNGCGIPKENLEKVFDPFFTTKPVGRGTGQGLAIAQSIIVEKHAGGIEIESVVGRGTSFILRLPTGGRGPKVTS